MRNCLTNCLRDLFLWILGGSIIGAIVAFFMGISIVVGTATIAVFPPGIIAALVALVGIFILAYLVGLLFCLNRCRRRNN